MNKLLFLQEKAIDLKKKQNPCYELFTLLSTISIINGYGNLSMDEYLKINV